MSLYGDPHLPTDLERMCAAVSVTTLRIEPVCPGLEIATATGLRHPFRPHQHDCYVIGLTSSGVQSFGYRGEQRHARLGQAFAIHPGETHDGRPGTDVSYGYRAVYIAPDLVSGALATPVIPFVREPVGQNRRLVAALTALFDITRNWRDNIALADGLSLLADAIVAMSDSRSRQAKLPDRAAAIRLRDDMKAHAVTGRSMRDLERHHGLDRFTICRVFRRHFGVSPQAFLVSQRVLHARALIEGQMALADAAVASGFSDQSHMTRQFVRSMGVTPGQWRDLCSRSQ